MLKTAMRLNAGSLLSTSAVYLTANILSAAIPFVLLPILTRYLSPTEYGEVAMFQTLLGALAAFVGLNAPGAAVRKYYDREQRPGELPEFIAACLHILLGTTLLALAATFALRGYLEDWLGLSTEWMLWAVATSAFTVLINIQLGQWQASRRAVRYGTLQVGSGAVNFALSLMLVIVFAGGAAGRIAAQVWAAALAALIALFFLRREGLLQLAVWNTAHMREALRFGVPLIPHVAGMFVLSSIDRVVVKNELGLSQTGVYMVAAQLGGVMSIAFNAINKAFVPWLYERLKRDQPEEKKRIVRYTYAFYVAALASAGLIFLVGPWLVRWIAGDQYAAAGDVIGWLALGQAFGGMYLMVTNYIFYSKRTGLLSVATILSGVANIMLLVLLVQSLGMQGAGIAFAAAMGFRFLATWWVAQRRHPMPWFGSRSA